MLSRRNACVRRNAFSDYVAGERQATDLLIGHVVGDLHLERFELDRLSNLRREMEVCVIHGEECKHDINLCIITLHHTCGDVKSVRS